MQPLESLLYFSYFYAAIAIVIAILLLKCLFSARLTPNKIKFICKKDYVINEQFSIVPDDCSTVFEKLKHDFIGGDVFTRYMKTQNGNYAKLEIKSNVAGLKVNLTSVPLTHMRTVLLEFDQKLYEQNFGNVPVY